jgi:transcriptional regulator with XRE-family HTH domain
MKTKRRAPTLGGKILELIEAQGLTIAAAAKKVRMTRQQLWRIIRGDVPNPGFLTVQRIVRKLGGQMKDFFKDFFADGDTVTDEGTSHQDRDSPAKSRGAVAPFDPSSLQDERRRDLASKVLRPGQKAFRDKLMQAYGGRCAITGCNNPTELEAAHIIPYGGPNSDHVCNGILLRVDLHALFDAYELSIEPRKMNVCLRFGLCCDDHENINGRRLRLPKDFASQPSYEALLRHFREFESRDG